MSVSCQEMILSNDYSDWITDFELTPEIIGADANHEDYCYRQVDSQLGLVFVRRDRINPISFLNYAYQHIPNVFGLQQEPVTFSGGAFDPTPLINSGITQVQRPPLNLTGKGTVIALLDVGIDYQNPVFLKPDGSSRILAIWDQTIQEGEPPEGFYYGTEYSQEKINEALKSERPLEIVPSQDTNGHGTAMASVAAGSFVTGEGTFIGAAPDAELVIVKLKECKPYLREFYLLPENVPAYQSTDIIMAMEYADRFAQSFYRPVIFCIGVGSSFGSHSGNSPLSNYLNRIAAKRSRVVVVAGGNEGNSANHYEGTLDPVDGNNVKESREEIEIRVGEGEKGFLAEVWGKAPNQFSLGIRSPGGETIPNTRIRVGRGVEYQFVYEQTNITVSYALVEGATGDELITIRFENPTPGIWTIILQNDSGLPGAEFHIWLPISQFLSGETYFLQPNPNITLTIPSYAQDCITVSSYSDRSNSIYVRSGRGFSRGSIIKPDLAAPAVDISAVVRGLPGEVRLGRITGSSMAAAITAGGVAQFMQWAVTDKHANYLRSSEVKNYLIRGAVRDPGLNYPNQQWGFGKLSIQGVFDSLAGP
ncbi:MAG: S8 family peptidase [Lachnospiraceae bacterium]|nr:S8 family peptidase [Lachnospiraceae bacterium]